MLTNEEIDRIEMLGKEAFSDQAFGNLILLLVKDLKAARRVIEAAEHIQHYDCAVASKTSCALCRALADYKQATEGE